MVAGGYRRQLDRIFLVTLVLIAVLMKGGISQIMIAHGPENVTVVEGASASFPCIITGTAGVPIWCIVGSVYTIRDLPDRHYYSNFTLTVRDVELSDNGAEYQCFFHTLSSRTAVLTVITVTEESRTDEVATTEVIRTELTSLYALQFSTVLPTPVSTTNKVAATEVVHTESSTSMYVQPSTLPTSFSVQNNVTNATTPTEYQELAQSGSEIKIYILIVPASIVMVLFGGVIVVLVLLVRFHRKGCSKGALKRAEDSRMTEAAYEDVGDVAESRSGFTIDVNACYSLKQDPIYAEIEDAIKIKLNDAYASTSQHVNQKALHSAIPPRPIAEHMSSGNGPLTSGTSTPHSQGTW